MSQHPDLPFEQAKNVEYLGHLDRKAHGQTGVSVTRSRAWVDPAGLKMPAPISFHPLVGRLGFDAEDPYIGRACYIGPSRLEADGLQVFSWDAPIARLFFGTSGDGYTVDGQLAVRRTFDHQLDGITDLDDEWLSRVDPSPFTPHELHVPVPATTSRSRSRRVIAPPLDGPVDEGPVGVSSTEIPSQRERARANVNLKGMRAATTVLKKLAAPRSASLRTVLATLQPDQFDVVSRPPDQDLLIQGHPGTGKTVVAAYRAAYLVSPERGDARASSVLLIGPTLDYVAHVSGLLRPLDPEGRVHVTHISQVLDRTVNLKKHQWSGGIGGEHSHIDAHARKFTLLAERLLNETKAVPSGPTARRDHIQAIYSLVRSNGLPARPLSSDREDAQWMRQLPPFERAIRLRRYLPLMAQISLAFQPIPFTDQVTHLLIDEAQDMSPIEWNVIEAYLRPGGRWTVVGDMNQRRSDATYSSWASISDHLGLGKGDRPLDLTTLKRGYRSTTPILQFADKLLPASQRGATSIQAHGPKPKVEYVASAGSLASRAIEAARQLVDTYRDGTVALITVDPGMIIQILGTRGWRRGETHNVWSRDGQVLRIFVPEAARGLEFDGVVVVEPGAFPENLGREGQLYTSLTRANRELIVLWHRDLPDALRKAARR